MPKSKLDPSLFDCAESWGALHIHAPGERELAELRAKIVEAYTQAGVKAQAWNPDRPEGVIDLEEPVPTLGLNPTPTLGADEVLVLQEATEGWVAVLSREWEWAHAGKHPLALALSPEFRVFSVTCIERRFAEYSVYEDGRLVECSLVGPEPPVAPKKVPALDLDWFEDKGAAVSAEQLADAMNDPDRFLALLGPDQKGFRDTIEGAPLTDFPPQEVLIFR